MCFVVVNSKGIWTFTNFLDSLSFAKEISTPEDQATIVESSALTKIIMETY